MLLCPGVTGGGSSTGSRYGAGCGDGEHKGRLDGLDPAVVRDRDRVYSQIAKQI